MADESTTAGLTVIQGGGTNPKPPTPEFDPTTRTSIQKRIQPMIGELKTVVKAAINSEFNGALKTGHEAHERRFARALLVEVERLMFDAGIRLANISHGAAGSGGSLKQDLIESGVIKVEAPKYYADDDENEEENEDENED